MRVAFGEYQLDSEKRTLLREGQRIRVQSKAFDLLAYLIERRERVVCSDELLDALWPGLHVTPAALSTAVQKARQAVGDDGERQAVLHTEHGKGFRFVAEVTDLSTPAVDSSRAEAARPAPETDPFRSAGTIQLPLIAELKRRNVLRVAAAYGIVAWLLVEVASVVLPTFEAPEWVMQVLTFLAILGFPLALILAWAFELTPEGIKLEASVDRAKSITRQTGRKLDFAIIGLLALAVVFLAVDHYVLEAEPPGRVNEGDQVLTEGPIAQKKSVAVLAFVNLSADENQEGFAEGISEEILNKLAHLEGLRVVARTSSWSFKDSNADVKEIGEALSADVILEGSVRTAGNRVRITAQLNDATDGYHLWSEIYDRELTDIFAIQTEIATAIADEMLLSLSPDDSVRLATPPTQNLDAYQAYLLGRQRVARWNNVDLAESIDYFQQAIKLDPSFALAYAGLADAYLWQAGISGLPRDEMVAKAQAAIDQAISLDDQLGEAYAQLAGVKHYRNDFEGAEDAYQRALKLNPNDAQTYNHYGYLLRDLDRAEEALTLHQKALELDPLAANIITNVGHDLTCLGRYDEALAHYEKALEIDPDFSATTNIADHYWRVKGQLDQAVVWIANAISRDPGSPHFSAWLGMLFLDLGDRIEGEYWIERSLELSPEIFWSNHTMQLLGVYNGNENTAWDYGRKALKLEYYPGRFDWPELTLLRDHELRAGRHPEARALYETNHPELLNTGEPIIRHWNYQAAVDLALVLSRTGEQAHADLLLNLSSQFIQNRPRFGELGYGIADVEIFALQGKKRRALSTLRKAIDEGWRYTWWYYLEHNLNLESLHGEPEFQAMVAEIETDMAEQLARVREMERNGELAAISRESTAIH